jgi:preprotein translocase subunit SecG
MINILISFLTFVLILVSIFMVLVVLMQRANTNSGMGSAFGGGVTESAFGADTTNVLVKATKWSASVFFAISLVLYLLYMAKTRPASGDDAVLPVILSETVPASAELPPASAPNAAVTGDLVTEPGP